MTLIHDSTVLAGDGWTHPVRAGELLRITDLAGNQAADTLFYDLHDPADRYDAALTVRRQGRVYVSTGSVLYASSGNALLTVTGDTCGRHDTIGGACACESNQVRYAIDKLHMHACRQTFLLQLAREAPKHGCATLGKRDIAHNLNFFMNVPVTPDGGLCFADGISAPGRHIELRAERDVLCVISNCPQLNNPCNGWNPTPIQVTVSRP